MAGGQFNNIGGQLRYRIARLDPATGLADSFNPNPTNASLVESIAAQTDGKILVGGVFNSIDGQPRDNIARVDPITGLADSFNPGSNNVVREIAVQPDGKILIVGEFTVIDGQLRNHIARLYPTASPTPTPTPDTDSDTDSDTNSDTDSDTDSDADTDTNARFRC